MKKKSVPVMRTIDDFDIVIGLVFDNTVYETEQ
jgi:hypothetical protein